MRKEQVFITGATGFLGKWLTQYLSSNSNYEVIAVGQDFQSKTNFEKRSNLILEDSSSLNWANLLQSYHPAHVISCDWSGVGAASRNNRNLQLSNIPRVSELAKECVIAGVKTFIAFGSQAENGPLTCPAFEINYDNPTTDYGKAKVEVRQILESIFANSQTRFVWGRIFSTYGPMDHGYWFIQELTRCLLNEETFEMTSGVQIWSYLHAWDFARAAHIILKNKSLNGLINIGNPETVTIRYIAESIASYVGRPHNLKIGIVEHRPDQVFFMKPELETLSKVGWLPEISYEEGLKSVVNWRRGKQDNFRGIRLTAAS